ncbi:hypothetical protein G6F50_014258 [Rhizopus delemar]|uniref:Uncharacterized protein n=1 Tax=Rhizopus delemar TaxID=936053 RepID=A0A9P6Y7D0_9FUNG|nr:hypothetical protein G6F50_014258 [Rhizopus delemar]
MGSIALTIIIRECTGVQCLLEVAWLPGIEVQAKLVDNQGVGRHEVGTQPHRSDESIFHAQEGGAGFLRQGRYGISGRCTPKDQAVVRHWIQLCRRFRVRDEKHRPIGMPQKGLYVFGLPSAIADCDRSACAALMHSALMAEPIDHIENRAAFVCFRIQVSRVVQVRGRKKLVDRTGARAPWTFHAVVGASPPGIPRHPKTGDRNPVEQGLETHDRGA